MDTKKKVRSSLIWSSDNNIIPLAEWQEGFFYGLTPSSDHNLLIDLFLPQPVCVHLFNEIVSFPLRFEKKIPSKKMLSKPPNAKEPKLLSFPTKLFLKMI